MAKLGFDQSVQPVFSAAVEQASNVLDRVLSGQTNLAELDFNGQRQLALQAGDSHSLLGGALKREAGLWAENERGAGVLNDQIAAENSRFTGGYGNLGQESFTQTASTQIDVEEVTGFALDGIDLNNGP
jgi:hypothetical protein